MAKAKTTELKDLYPLIENQTTSDQIALREFINKLLNDKKEKAAEELNLIQNNGK